MPSWASSLPPSRSGVLGARKFPGEGEAELSPDDGCLLPCWGWRASLASSCFPSGPCHIPSLGGGQGEDTTPHLGTWQAPALLIQETGNPPPASWPPPRSPTCPSRKQCRSHAGAVPGGSRGTDWGRLQAGWRCRPHQPVCASVSPGGCRVAGEPSVRKMRVQQLG